jgi:hypothetical protein
MDHNQGEKSGQVLPFSRMAIWLFGYHRLSLGTGQFSAALTLFCDNRRGHGSQPRGKIRAGFIVQPLINPFQFPRLDSFQPL